MFSAAVRVLARAATIQLEEAAAAHPRPAARTLLKGKERALPIRRDIRPEPAVVESDLGVHAGTEGFGGKEGKLAENKSVEKGAGHGMEEHLASIVDELPRKDGSTPGPSRITRNRPIDQPQRESIDPSPAVTNSTLRAHDKLDKLEADITKTAPLARPTAPRPIPTPTSVSPVEDSPLVQSELPITDQLHEILNAKTDESSPESKAKPKTVEQPSAAAVETVKEPVVSPPTEPLTKSSDVSSSTRIEEIESGDVFPTANEPPLPVAEEAEDVSPFLSLLAQH
jgi:hypothetical protein